MTSQMFVAWAEAVFGKYMPAMRAEVVNWLDPHNDWFRLGMRAVSLVEHPSVYGKPPGVHELEQMKVKAYERGHALEAIDAARKTTPLLSSESDEEYMPADAAIRILRETIEKLERKSRA